jgi:hypothetical protein
MKIAINKILRWVGGPEDVTHERILHIDSSGTNVAVIDVEDGAAEPVWRKYDEIARAIEIPKAVLLDYDAFAPSYSEEELSLDKYKVIRDRRDTAYRFVAPLFEGENAVKMLYPRERSALIAQRVVSAAREGIFSEARKKLVTASRQTIYVYVRRWYQGGQTKNALIPRFRNSGARGVPRLGGEVKRGRPTIIAIEESAAAGVKVVTGANVDEKWHKIIIRGGQLFYEHRNRKSIIKAYRKTLDMFCGKVNGKRPDYNRGEIFSPEQFKHHYLKHREANPERALVNEHGQTFYDVEYRPSRGHSTAQTIGPGSLYQIDASVGDVYLRSRIVPSRIIGRPTIYTIIDVFSRMIVGICVRLEGEGWLGVRLALENATSDKVAFCAEYGIDIDEVHWPSSHLPDEITGDRGPMKLRFADEIPRSLEIDLSNMPPRRPDWKGIVEQAFNQMNIRLIHGLPGAVDPKRRPGDPDYRLKAAYNIHDLTEVLISTTLFYNNKHYLPNYPMRADMARDGVKPYPAQIYRWGIENKMGKPRWKDPDEVRVSLLPGDTATITGEGLLYGCEDQLYTCDDVEVLKMFHRAKVRGKREPARIVFEPRCADIIYLRPENGLPSIPLRLKDPESPYRGCDWKEVRDYERYRKYEKALARVPEIHDAADLDATVERVNRRAVERTSAYSALLPEQSKSSQTRNIRQNKKEEIVSMQKEEARQLVAKEFPHLLTASKALNAAASISGEEHLGLAEVTDMTERRKRMMNNGE